MDLVDFAIANMEHQTLAERDRAQVIAEIAAAFAGVQREDGISLHEADALDDYASAEERLAARALDTEEHWIDVPEEELERMYWVHSYFDAKGFRYYLPAFMIWSLGALAHPTTNTISLDSTLFALTPGAAWLEERTALLTPEQVQAVCRFLRYLVCHDEGYAELAQRALDLYWGRFAGAHVS